MRTGLGRGGQPLNYELTGVDSLVKRLEALDEKVKKKTLLVACRKAANLLRKDMRARAPKSAKKLNTIFYYDKNGRLRVFKITGVARQRDKSSSAFRASGHLRRHLRVRRLSQREHGQGPNAVVFRVYATKSAWYARIVEFGSGSSKGHRGMRPRPFMRPAMDAKFAEMSQIFAEAIKTAVSRADLK